MAFANGKKAGLGSILERDLKSSKQMPAKIP